MSRCLGAVLLVNPSCSPSGDIFSGFLTRESPVLGTLFVRVPHFCSFSSDRAVGENLTVCRLRRDTMVSRWDPSDLPGPHAAPLFLLPRRHSLPALVDTTLEEVEEEVVLVLCWCWLPQLKCCSCCEGLADYGNLTRRWIWQASQFPTRLAPGLSERREEPMPVMRAFPHSRPRGFLFPGGTRVLTLRRTALFFCDDSNCQPFGTKPGESR